MGMVGLTIALSFSSRTTYFIFFVGVVVRFKVFDRRKYRISVERTQDIYKSYSNELSETNRMRMRAHHIYRPSHIQHTVADEISEKFSGKYNLVRCQVKFYCLLLSILLSFCCDGTSVLFSYIAFHVPLYAQHHTFSTL